MFIKILVLELMTRMLLANQIAGFFKVDYLVKETSGEINFLHADKHQCFVQGDTILCGEHFWACPKYIG